MFSRPLAFAALASLSMLTACGQTTDINAKSAKFRAQIQNPNGDVVGTAIVTEIGAGGVELSLTASGIPEGAHGMHFHVKADCSSIDFKSAGGHINPMGKPHGLAHPEGPDNADMPNGVADDEGNLVVSVTNDRVTLYPHDERPALLDEDGSALIIHINPDDGVTQPIGGAGARIACAPIILED